MSKLLLVLLAFIELVNKLVRHREQKEKESEVEQIRENPGDWFNDHFNSVSDSGMPTDARTANKTDATRIDSESGRRNDIES